MERKTIWIQLNLDEHSSGASIQDIRPYIERMVSFSIDSPSKEWKNVYDEPTFIVDEANCRKLFIKNRED